MSTGTSRDRHDATAILRSLRDRWRQIETAAVWFLLLNCLDAAFTYILLRLPPLEEGGHRVVEANRIAAWFLDRWGFQGLFGFKLFLALFVCGIAMVIASRNVDLAKRLLVLGTLTILMVVVYSAWLARHMIYGG